jgi:hypothetical protein
LSVRSIPVLHANVASVICGNTTAVDDDAENDETSASGDLDETDDKLDLAITLDSEELDDDKQEEQGNDPGSVVDVFCSLPVVDLQRSQHETSVKLLCLPTHDVASSRDLEWQHSQPTDGVLPRHGESQRRVNEATDVHGECTVDRVHDRQLCKSLHHEVARVSMSVENVVVERWNAYTMKPSEELANGSQHVVRHEQETYQRS